MTLTVRDWGFDTSPGDGALVVGGVRAEDAARELGTPLHLVDEAGLRARARTIRAALQHAYAGPATACFAMKANSTPAIVALAVQEGLEPEVGTAYEWWLARRLGVDPARIVVNGPNKGTLLRSAVEEGAGLIVVDGLQELEVLEATCAAAGARARVLLRINPDVVPRGMNRGSATGSRRHSVFGLDVRSGEVSAALARAAASRWIDFMGFHCHAGSGIHRPEDYQGTIAVVLEQVAEASRRGLRVRVLDVGGGFGVATSRELDTREFLVYQAVGRLPAPPDPSRFPGVDRFAAAIGRAVEAGWRALGLSPLPRLVVEPGRSVVSGAGVLLVRVGAVKPRPGVGTWLLTDGGAGTVAFPLFYELHEVLLCRAPHAARTERYAIVGSACFSADWVYRNKRMPPVAAGDVLAICDAGAYFTVQESSFGFPRPAIAVARDGALRLVRRRETFEDMVARDIAGWSPHDT